MGQKLQVRDTEEFCRQKASLRIEKLKHDLKSHDPSMDDFSILAQIHATAKETAERCRENIEDGHHIRHIDTPALVIAFENAARVAVHIMDMACTQMMTMKNNQGEYLTSVNCTSLKFQACAVGLLTERQRIPTIAKIIDTEILPLLAHPVNESRESELSLH